MQKLFRTQDRSLSSDFVTAHSHQRHHVYSMHTLETPLLLLEIKMLYFDHSDYTLLTSFIWERIYFTCFFVCLFDEL